MRGLSDLTRHPTAMKKTTSKSTKSPAPATNKSVPAAKSGLTAKPFGSGNTKPAVATKTTPPIASKTTPPMPVKPKRVDTTITALIDVGFGNSLFIRGEGAGLSWDKGTPLDCVADDKWSITLGESARSVVFKFLINDTAWSAGDDYTVAPGTSITVTPVF